MTPIEEIAAERRPAFPSQDYGPDGLPCASPALGISRLDYFVAHSPICGETVWAMWQNERPSGLPHGPEYLAFWARKRVDLTRAMIAEIERLDRLSRATEEPTP